MARSVKGRTGTETLLLLQVPRANDKKELAAEQLYASLHGLLTIPVPGLLKPAKRERISLELAVVHRQIGFYVWVPTYLKTYVEEQIYAQYPSVNITEVPDYTFNKDQVFSTALITELKFTSNNALPIKTFQTFEVDPLAAITATLAKFEENEEAWIQVIVRPAPANWNKKSERFVATLRGRARKGNVGVLSMLWSSPSAQNAQSISNYDQLRAKGAEEKSQKLAFETVIRIVYRGQVPNRDAKLQIQSIIASFKQFNTTYLNGFVAKRIMNDPYLFALYRARDYHGAGFICNIEEIATLYHLPHTNVQTPYVLWSLSQTAEPPSNLPVVGEHLDPAISPIAATNFRGHSTMFGIPRFDRSRHLYVMGQTGVGKSKLLELLTISDIYTSYGFAIIDPHGDFAVDVLRRIPEKRVGDVIYFNPADINYPMAFNPMELHDKKLRIQATSELIGVLKKMFDSWGARLEYILRYCILALLDYPESTMLDITRILTDNDFRNEVIDYIEDPIVKKFWQVEFAAWSGRFASEAVAPVLNKIGAFTANPLIRNIIGQPKGSFNIRKIMDEKKILIVNLSRGLIGEDNAALLGSLLVTKIQLAAMSRADVTIEHRLPFYLYVDEFQNFATETFATILSEARKYGLNLTVANQYIAQMIPSVRDAIFGNVGSIISFRTSVDDARGLQRYFEPKFTEHDLVHMHNRHFIISMTIQGEKAAAFSAISLNLPEYGQDLSETIIEQSREQYATKLDIVERNIKEKYLASPKKIESPIKSEKDLPSPKTKKSKSKSKKSSSKTITKTVVSNEVRVSDSEPVAIEASKKPVPEGTHELAHGHEIKLHE